MSINSWIRSIAAVGVISLATAGFAIAQSASVSLGVQNHDSDLPVEITSQELALDQENSLAIFTGDVLVRQGELTMACNKMRVEYGPDADGNDEIKVIRMFGGVTLAGPEETAESDGAVYDLIQETLVMTGNVLITQGITALASDQMNYDLTTGDGVLQGNVKTVLRGNN